MARVVHFEIHAKDPEKLISFYSGLFEWLFQKWDGPMEYWMIVTGPSDQAGINGGLLRRQSGGPVEMAAVNAYVCTIGVSSLDSTLTRLLSLGGTVAVGKMPIPGIGWLAYGKDPDGNIFGMMEPDNSAA